MDMIMAVSPPFALFVGPTKSGTTWVHAYLESRGDIVMPKDMKETFFFDKVYERGFEWYAGLFPGDDDQRLRVEVAPSLFHKPYACERVAHDIPYAKIICTVRNPFDRAVSHYFHYRKRGMPRCSLSQASKIYADVIDAGAYAKHSPNWENAFGKDRFHMISYHLLRENPDEFCRQLCDILEIDFIPPDMELTSRQINSASVPRNLVAAKVLQNILTWLRRNGWHSITRIMKQVPVKRWLYSGGMDLEKERSEIKKESSSFSPELTADWATFLERTELRNGGLDIKSH
jgi:hypothetical protein